jgi:hypothetical protein
MVDPGLLFLDSARPEAIHEHTRAVSERRLIIGALDFNRHGICGGTVLRGFQNAALQT